jgi:hypothetical protein
VKAVATFADRYFELLAAVGRIAMARARSMLDRRSARASAC